MSEAPHEDAAWVRIATGLSPAALTMFCQDVERLLRINSMYEFQEWRPEGENRFFMRARNLGNERTIATPIRVLRRPDGLRIVYEAGLKTATEFRVEPPPGTEERGTTAGAVLIVTDDYSGMPEAERRARAEEIDQSLVAWGHDLHRYLRYWVRWSGFAPWRWYMRRVWQPMKPTARRITFILIAITVFEFLMGALAIAVFGLFWE